MVIYLHAIGLDSRLWDGIAVEGSRTINLPGHGDQPKLPGALTFDTLTDHLEQFITEPATIVGISLGSMLAQQFAVRRPHLVHSLVLACAAAKVPAELMRHRSNDTRSLGMAATLPSTLERWFSIAALHDASHAGVAYARTRLLDDDPEVVADYWLAIASHDLSGRLHEIQKPTTVVAATEDVSFPSEAIRELAHGIPNSRLREIPGPHMVPLEDPTRFRDLVEEHLSWAGPQT